MKFQISRTSILRDDKPCDEAVAGERLVIDERGFKTPEDFDLRFPNDPWLSRGSNHRLTEIGIARDFGNEPCWLIEIDTLGELSAISEKYGELVFHGNRIEIYDDSRE